MAKVYISLRRNDEGEKELLSAIRQDATDDNAKYFLGALYVQAGEYAKSLPYMERAHKVTPDSWPAAYYLGKARLKLKDSKGAVPLLQQAAELNPDEPTVFYALASALRELGRTDEAKQALRRVNELHTSSLEVEKKFLQDSIIVGAR